MPRPFEKLSYQLTWQEELGIERVAKPAPVHKTPVSKKNPFPISDAKLIDKLIDAIRRADHGLETKLRKEFMRRLKKLR